MKKIFLFAIFIVSATLLLANNDDPKYLKNAVPEVNGRVVFERQLNINQSISQDDLYKLVQAWCDTAFKASEDGKQRILLEDKANYTIAVQGYDPLVFKSTILALDKSDLMYQLILKVEKGKCLLTFSNLRYYYQDFDPFDRAENLITDKYAYNAEKNTLNRYYNKFRTFTIDLVDGKTNELRNYLSSINIAQLDQKQAEILRDQQSKTNIVTVDTPTVSLITREADEGDNVVQGDTKIAIQEPKTVEPVSVAVASKNNNTFEGYKSISDAKSLSNYQAMIAQSKLLIISEDGKHSIASWNGVNEMNAENVATTTILKQDESNITNQYTISFINNSIYTDELNSIEKDQLKLNIIDGNNKAIGEAWMIIVCKKLMTLPASSNQDESAVWSKLENGNKSIVIGEIEQIWVR